MIPALSKKNRSALILPVLLAVLMAWALPVAAMEVMENTGLSEVSAQTGVTINIPVASGVRLDSSSFLAFYSSTGVPGYTGPAYITLDDIQLYQYYAADPTVRSNKLPVTLTLDATPNGLRIGLPAFNPGISLSLGALRVGATAEGGSSFGRFELGNVVMPAGALTLRGGGYTDSTVGIEAHIETAIGASGNMAYLGYEDTTGLDITYPTPGWLGLGGLTVDRGTGYADYAPVDIYCYMDLGTDTVPDPDKTYWRVMLPQVGGAQQQFRLRSSVIGIGSSAGSSNKLMEAGLFLKGSIQLNVTNYTVGATRYETFYLGNGSGGRFGVTDAGVKNGSYLYICDSDGDNIVGRTSGATGPGYIVFNDAYLTGSGGPGTDGSLDGITFGAGNNGGVYIFGGNRPTASVIDVGFDLHLTNSSTFATSCVATNRLFTFEGDNVTFPAMQMYFNPVNNTGIRLTGSPFFRLGDKTLTNRYGGIYDGDTGSIKGEAGFTPGYMVLDQFDMGFYGTIDLNVTGNYFGAPAARLTGTNVEFKFFSNAFFNNAINKAGLAKELGTLEFSIPFNTLQATIRNH
ncbi:MAG: hypothetical protein KKA60_14900 [Proteobacteria bacterium]|nr:hypothetical protein [Pseudomonadota bacterium]